MNSKSKRTKHLKNNHLQPMIDSDPNEPMNTEPINTEQKIHTKELNFFDSVESFESTVDKGYIPEYIPSIENCFLIENKYEIVDNHHNDLFHIFIYYIHNNECLIHVRRLDGSEWGQDLKLIIWNIENTFFEKISMGSSYYISKTIIYRTKLKLNKKTNIIKNNDSNIVFSCGISSKLNNMKEIHHLYINITLLPEYQFIYFNEDDSRKFIKEKYSDEILYIYDKIYDISIQNEFMKYAYLCLNSGYYMYPNSENYINHKNTDTFYHFLDKIKIENTVFYNNKYKNDNIIIYIEPYVYKDTFEINNIQNLIYRIKRTDRDSEGWGQHLKIKVVSSNCVQRMEIGPSTENVKIFKIAD